MIKSFGERIRMKILSEINFYTRNYRKGIDANSEIIPKRVIKRYCSDPKNIIDCGAHIGSDSVELARFFPRAAIYSFEAVPAIYNSLKRNVRNFANIRCFELALSSFDGKATMNISSGDSDASSSLLRPKEHLTDHPGTVFENLLSVNCMTLDTWAELNNIARIDLLWLDMQGFELQMLEKSPKMLSTVSVIHTEVSVKETYEGVQLYKDSQAFLASNSFVVVTEAIPPGWDMGNVLFVRNIKR